MKRLFYYLRGFGFRMAIGLTIKTVGTFMDLCIPWALAHIIDDIIPLGDIKLVYIWGGVMLLFSLIAWSGNIVANRMAASVSRDAIQKLRLRLFTKISYLSNTDVDKFTIPSLISRMTSDTYTVHHALGMMQRIGIRAPILLLGGIIVTMISDPALTSIMLVLLPIVAFMTFYVSKNGARLFKIVQSAVDSLVRTVRENAAGIRVIKALSKSDYEKGRFRDANRDLTEKERRAETVMAFINPAMSVLLNLGLCAVILFGAFRVNEGKSEIGNIIAFMTYFTIILNSIMTITRVFMNLSRASASAARIDEVLDCPDEYALGGDVCENPDAPAIEFDHVSFAYETKKRFAVSDINFRINRGETLGILGPTGCGKTALISLLLRFYRVNKGAIKINGVDISDFTLHDLRRKFGTVLQHDTLFHDSVFDNISFGRSLSEDDVRAALRAAQAEEFVDAAGGLSAEVAIKGANFSGGQQQRLLISRALAGQPEIFIFDDSFSALDYKTDSLLRERLRLDFADKTKIIVTQRVSSVLSAEHILVMDAGKCVGFGTHEELMRTCDIYRETASLQLGGVCNEK